MEVVYTPIAPSSWDCPPKKKQEYKRNTFAYLHRLIPALCVWLIKSVEEEISQNASKTGTEEGVERKPPAAKKKMFNHRLF